MKAALKRNDLVYPELSYEIVGCAYGVWNELGPGHLEKVYQKSLAISNLKLAILINFTKEGVKFKRIININQGS